MAVISQLVLALAFEKNSLREIELVKGVRDSRGIRPGKRYPYLAEL